MPLSPRAPGRLDSVCLVVVVYVEVVVEVIFGRVYGAVAPSKAGKAKVFFLFTTPLIKSDQTGVCRCTPDLVRRYASQCSPRSETQAYLGAVLGHTYPQLEVLFSGRRCHTLN